MIKKSSFNLYFNHTKDLLTNVIFLFPLFILYELISFIKFNDSNIIIRNSADSILRDIYAYFIGDTFNYYSFIFILFFLIVYIYKKDDLSSYSINIKYLFYMYFEGFILGFLLLFILNDSSHIIKNNIIYLNDVIFAFYLCLGAGIWEEILFRLCLYSLLFLFINKIIQKQNLSKMVSIILSSLIFSSFHYIGTNPDIFSLYTFIIRFIGGFILCYIYIIRGLGIACMTHFSYDFLLVILPVI